MKRSQFKQFLIALVLFFIFSLNAYSAPLPIKEKCSLAYAKLVSIKEKITWENIGSALRNSPRTVYNFAFANTVKDYKEAWSEESPRKRMLKIMKRFFWAPRVREADPVKRAEELKKIQWLTMINEPAVDGMIEVTSKLKQRFGESLGLTNKPFEGNLSIPGSIVFSLGTGYGTWPLVEEKIKKHNLEKKIKENHLDKEKDLIGTKYLEEWEELGLINAEQKINLLQQNNAMINSWGKNLSSTDPQRPLPPRFYQFQVEGLFRNAQELSEFEDIALFALTTAQKKASKDPSIKLSTEIKKMILEKISASPKFSQKSESQKNMLLMAFEPPIFLDGKNENFFWYKDFLQKKSKNYLEERRKFSDIYWQNQLANNKKDPKLTAIRELYGESLEPDAPTLLFTAMNFSPDATKKIEEKVALARRADWFPPNQVASIQRLDHPLNIFGSIDFPIKDNENKKLKSEMDYYELWSKHPFFHEEIKEWKNSPGPKAISLEEFSKLKESTRDLSIYNKVMQIKKEAIKKPEGGIPDPNLQEFCFLQKNTKMVANYFSDAKEKSPFCEYIMSVALWRVADLSQKEFQQKIPDPENVLRVKRKLLEQAREKCLDPQFQASFSKNAGFDFEQIQEKLKCDSN